jgi:hypothetical protein
MQWNAKKKDAAVYTETSSVMSKVWLSLQMRADRGNNSYSRFHTSGLALF